MMALHNGLRLKRAKVILITFNFKCDYDVLLIYHLT